jgi:alpha-glucosidase (family GH31 glycosyl hydrolase)
VILIAGAETWMDLADHPLGGKRANFILESGVLEFFMFASHNPKAQMKKLATIAGFPRLPPWWSLGFHYSKWEKTSAERVMELDRNFE